MQDYKPTLSLKLENHNTVPLFIFDGALDKAGLDTVKEEVERQIESTASNVVALDFSKLNFINSESIGFLLTLHTRLVKKGKRLILYGANEHVLDVLNVIGMLKIISSYPTEEAMMKDLKL